MIEFVVQRGVYTDTFIKTNAGWRFTSINVNVTHANRLDTQSESTTTPESFARNSRP